MAKAKRKTEVIAEEPQAPVPASATMSAYERYQLASHKDRPRSLDFIEALFTEFTELHGDRNFRDDPAVVTGMARFDEKPVVVVGQEMGKEARERHNRNYGMMHPEGYRKALRVMNLASRFSMPVLIFVDTKGAFPGAGAEERGQAEAIARNIRDMYKLRVPIIVTVIGAGASGGALGIGLGDRVLMLENSWYNVISPEGCAMILYNDNNMAATAAEQLRLTAEEVYKLGVIDEIVAEPNGGAHMDPAATFESLREALRKNLGDLAAKPVEQLLKERFTKFRSIGVVSEGAAGQEHSA